MILAREESPSLQRKMLMDHGHRTGHWTSEVESAAVCTMLPPLLVCRHQGHVYLLQIVVPWVCCEGEKEVVHGQADEELLYGPSRSCSGS